ncbi:MAG: lipopolysaccharide biosynthesis protein, partial [Candidatus Muiribacteriota bacterium]
MDKFKLYFKGSMVNLIAKFLQKFSGIAIIWFLNQILSKDDYGLYALSMTIISIATLIASFGLQRGVMYHLSRLDLKPGVLGGEKYASAAFWWSMITSCSFTLIFILLASWLASLFGKPDLTFWLIALAFLIPLNTGRQVYQEWFKSRQRIVESVFFSEILFNSLKVLLVLLVWLLFPSALGVALATV